MSSPTVLDARGQACPIPVITLARALEQAATGDEFVVLADDPGARVDIPVWCRMKGQQLMSVEQTGPAWRFIVRRAT